MEKENLCISGLEPDMIQDNGLPVAYAFEPKLDVIFKEFLKKKILNRDHQTEPDIPVTEVYAKHPETFFGPVQRSDFEDYNSKTLRVERYFFSTQEKVSQKEGGQRVLRTVKGVGTWVNESNTTIFIEKEGKLGVRKYFKYKESGKIKGSEDWKMYEFSLDSSMLLEGHENDLVLCKIIKEVQKEAFKNQEAGRKAANQNTARTTDVPQPRKRKAVLQQVDHNAMDDQRPWKRQSVRRDIANAAPSYNMNVINSAPHGTKVQDQTCNNYFQINAQMSNASFGGPEVYAPPAYSNSMNVTNGAPCGTEVQDQTCSNSLFDKEMSEMMSYEGPEVDAPPLSYNAGLDGPTGDGDTSVEWDDEALAEVDLI